MADNTIGDGEINDFAEAKRTNAAATALLRDVAAGKFAAAVKAPDAGATFAAAPRRLASMVPDAFDRAGGPRTT